jgi:hypothetical protein
MGIQVEDAPVPCRLRAAAEHNRGSSLLTIRIYTPMPSFVIVDKLSPLERSSIGDCQTNLAAAVLGGTNKHIHSFFR